MNRLLKLIALGLLAAASSAAQADEGDWYVVPSVAYFDDDPDRLIDAGVSGGQIQVGKEMGRHFWLEGLLGYHDIGGFPGQEHLELGINAVGNLLPDSLFSPYVIGGLGYLRADVGLPDFGGLPPAGDTANDITGTAGLGLRVRFGDSPWSLRTEWRLRRTFDSDDSLTDHIASIGLQYTFGDADDTVAPAAVAAAAPTVDSDTDGDGVNNDIDECPYTPRGAGVNSVGCIPDSDGDGVGDDRDRCPDTLAGVDVDAIGCNAFRLRNVYFATESARLSDYARGKLDETVAILKRYPDLQVDIAGHADSSGPEEFNLALSQRRADAVRLYLEEAGIDASRLTARGYGESQPAASNDTALGRSDNRRVELHALGR